MPLSYDPIHARYVARQKAMRAKAKKFMNPQSFGSVGGGSFTYTGVTTSAPTYRGHGSVSEEEFKNLKPGDVIRYNGQNCIVAITDPSKIDIPSRIIVEYSSGWPRHVNKIEFDDYKTVNVDRYNYVDCYLIEAIISKKSPPKPKVEPFDLTKLDSLILAKEVMEEIQAVLKQKKHASKIFTEWGLGDVIEYGKGMTFLFYGPPGTGKTWAANCIAKVFGTELITIGAAEIQTSEPGGANRNIQNAFSASKESGKVLFIDECDSLITSRNDLGMILGGEVNTLLTEIEKTKGVVILATNRIENLDEALERRISLIVEFPEPNFEQRQRIWERMLPKKLPLAPEITPVKLAEYKLTGGQIKNVLLQAARLALSADATQVEVAHIESSVDRIIKSKSLMGSASRYKTVRVKEDMTKA